jgi:hypothetical protein
VDRGAWEPMRESIVLDISKIEAEVARWREILVLTYNDSTPRPVRVPGCGRLFMPHV